MVRAVRVAGAGDAGGAGAARGGGSAGGAGSWALGAVRYGGAGDIPATVPDRNALRHL